MIERLITPRILEDLSTSPILGLIGPRQVGKTTLAKHLQTKIGKPTLYLDLEIPQDFMKLGDAEMFLSAHVDKCVIIDEVQTRPELFALLRGLTDQHRVPARFILLGSASPYIVKMNTETLAGRIAYQTLDPFSYSEIRQLTSMQVHWFRGGFPGALLAPTERTARKWLLDFAETFIQRDVQRLGFQVAQTTISNLLSMVAHLHGGILNASALAGSLGTSQPTVTKYLELLEGSFMIRRLPPYFVNLGKRLVKSPKVYVRDTGLLHHLMRIPQLEQLQGHPSVGTSWEGYVIEQIIREAAEFSDFYYYRTKDGAEVDLILLAPNGKMACIEIKYSTAPVISKGFFLCAEDLKPQFKYVITPAGDAWTRSDGVRICSLPEFLEKDLVEMCT
ncbi:MAG: ATP-binding protein [Saprospiraceae bacterium]